MPELTYAVRAVYVTVLTSQGRPGSQSLSQPSASPAALISIMCDADTNADEAVATFLIQNSTEQETVAV